MSDSDATYTDGNLSSSPGKGKGFYFLSKKIGVRSKNERSKIHAVALFPWNEHSLVDLWSGEFVSDEPAWKTMVASFANLIALGTAGCLVLRSMGKSKDVLVVQTHKAEGHVENVAWGINPRCPFEPLVLFSSGSVLYVLNVKTRHVSYIRGHGQPISCIAVNPSFPQIFCTTSRDCSTRIYDLTLPANHKGINPPWPPSNQPSMAGPAHGLRMNEDEGEGIGFCVAVLAGGRSGGHKAAVLSAAFHPNGLLPLIATSGMDRHVKIWRIPPSPDNKIDMIIREDKPIFTTSRLHEASILSVTWLSDDSLLTHSAPALVRDAPLDPNNLDTHFENGTIAIWRWLGFDRYFQANKDGDVILQPVLRGSTSDFLDSTSFKIITKYTLPQAEAEHANVPLSPRLCVSRGQDQAILLLLTWRGTSSIRIVNLATLEPRPKPVFPLEAKYKKINELSQSMAKLGVETENEEISYVLPKWNAISQHGAGGLNLNMESDGEYLSGCIMGQGGGVIVAFGERGTIWMWTAK